MKYPSQVRYEKKHPLISIRLTDELKEVFDTLRDGVPYSAVVHTALLEAAELSKMARDRYQITIPCAVCGEPIVVEPNGPIHLDIISKLRAAGGWKHGTC